MIRQDLPLAKPLFLPEPCTRMLQFVALDRETFSPTADKERRKKMCVLSPVSYWKLISFILFVVHHARAASRNATVILYEYVHLYEYIHEEQKCEMSIKSFDNLDISPLHRLNDQEILHSCTDKTMKISSS